MKILRISGLIFCSIILAASANAAVVDGDRIMDQEMTENLCALTFDDGPSIFTPQLLDTLAANGIKATFFMLGQRARQYPDIVRRIVAEGHEIENHSWSHPNLKHLSAAQQLAQIKATDEELKSLGALPFYLRPPYGAFDDRTIAVANELDLNIILWSMDSKDWKHLPAQYGDLRSTRGTVYEKGGMQGIFLFHDIHKSTVDDVPRIIAELKTAGCQRFVTVDEYLKGIIDPEPPILMSRHTPHVPNAPVKAVRKAYAAGSGSVKFARCSKPWEEPRDEALHLGDAHAAVEGETGS